MFRSIRTRFGEFTRQRRTVTELSRLTDRELNDIGISRADIYRVAASKF